MLVRGKVDRDDLGRAAPLELEREEAVRGADVQAALAADLRPRQPLDDRPQVEQPGCDNPGRDLDRVVPARDRGDRSARFCTGSAWTAFTRVQSKLAAVAQRLIFDFVADLTAAIDLPEPIVEFGSLQVEPDQPNDLRSLFAGREFVGTDLRPGPGVDRVEDLRALSFADGEIGTALCCDTLEHCADPLAACREMHRVLRDGGRVRDRVRDVLPDPRLSERLLALHP